MITYLSRNTVALSLLLLAQPLYTQPLLFIEGVTGAGKSTLTKILAAHIPDICIITEPFDKWNDINGTGNLFELFLQDPKRWVTTWQLYILLTHHKALHTAHTQHADASLYITDRSYLSGIFTFANLSHSEGAFMPIEWAIYQEITSWFIEVVPYKPQGIIYLRVTPETAYARATKRNRALRDSLSLSFYETLHHYHEEWLIEKKNTSEAIAAVPVLILDGEQDFESNPEVQKAFIEQITGFIEAVTK